MALALRGTRFCDFHMKWLGVCNADYANVRNKPTGSAGGPIRVVISTFIESLVILAWLGFLNH